VADEILQRLEKITKEILVDKMGVFGQTFENGSHEVRHSQLQNTEVGSKDKL
jgi:hypothetical protein